VFLDPKRTIQIGIRGNADTCGNLLRQRHDRPARRRVREARHRGDDARMRDVVGACTLSSAFDDTAVDFLEKMNVPAHKVASLS